MGLKTRKNTKGTVVEFMSRKKALRYLQVSLPVFQKLCLWKAVYPVRPKSMKKAGKGDSTEKSYFRKNDINVLLREPLLDTLRKIRSHKKKIKNAKARGDRQSYLILTKNKPKYSLRRLVEERFPTFESSLESFGPAMSLLFAFRRLPRLHYISIGMITLSHHLCFQFMYLLISMQAVRKVFIGRDKIELGFELVNGIESRVELPPEGTTANMLSDIDFRLLSMRAEFDLALAAVVLRKAFEKEYLTYPPHYENSLEYKKWDVLSSLSFDVEKSKMKFEITEEELQEQMELAEMDEDIPARVESTRDRLKVKKLFEGKKVFISREVPRELYTLIIRSCGGKVSWESAVGSLAPFPETDDDIDIQIVDRPTLLAGAHLTRYYVQPQYIVDSLNARRLLPYGDYGVGVIAPAHLSPWDTGNEGDYEPLEAKYLRGDMTKEELQRMDEMEAESDEEEVNELVEESDNEDDIAEFDSEDSDVSFDEKREIDNEKDDSLVNMSETKSKSVEIPKKKAVLTEEQKAANLKRKRENEERKNMEMHLPKKQRRLYKKILHSEKQAKNKPILMEERRKEYNRNLKRRKQK